MFIFRYCCNNCVFLKLFFCFFYLHVLFVSRLWLFVTVCLCMIHLLFFTIYVLLFLLFLLIYTYNIYFFLLIVIYYESYINFIIILNILPYYHPLLWNIPECCVSAINCNWERLCEWKHETILMWYHNIIYTKLLFNT